MTDNIYTPEELLVLPVDADGAMFSGWTLYEADSAFWNEEPVVENSITCFPIDERDPSVGYDVQVNPVLYGENVSTEELCHISCSGTGYYAIANWK